MADSPRNGPLLPVCPYGQPRTSRGSSSLRQGSPVLLPYPPLLDQADVQRLRAEKEPDQDYLIVGDTLPYGLVNMMARKAANALVTLGVRRATRSP